MTLFSLQNQVVVKVLTLVTMVMMVMSLVPMQVFAEGDAPVDPDAAQTVSAPVVVDPEEGKKIEKKVEEPTLLENLVSTLTSKPDPDEYFCHKAGNSYQKQPLNASNGNGHYGEGLHGHEGDIIPPAGAEGSHNWDAQGQAIWNNGCNMPVAAVSVDDVAKLTCDIKTVTIGGEVTFTIPTSGDSLVVKLDGVIVMDDEAIDDAGPDGVSQDWSYTLTNLSVGSHTVEVIIYDDAVANTGVKASDTTTFEIKACPPPTVSTCENFASVLTTNLSTWDLSQTRVTGHNAIVDNGLRIWTESNTATDKAAGYYTTNFPLSGLGNQTIDAALDYSATIGIEPGLQLVVDFDNNGTPDGILVGEAVYGSAWWLSNSAAQFVKDNAPNNGGGYGSLWYGTPNEWLSKFPNAKVLAIGYSLGSGVYGDGVINEINLGCTKYTFDLPAQEPVNQVKVHILKYLKVGEVTAQIPNDSTAPNFPMTSSWSAANIGTGSGSYVLGNNQGGTALRYAADTSFMDAPADYTTTETTGGDSVVLAADAQCVPGKYRLVGYKQGDTLQAAESASLSLTAPVYTDITTDKYVIVVNEKCAEAAKCAIGSNLILNGSFETETVNDHSGTWEIFSTVAGWLIGLSDGLEIWNNFDGTDAGLASDGEQNAELDGNNATNISQVITTVPGATYELKFDYSARAGTAQTDSKMDTLINGVSTLVLNTDGSAATTNNWEAQATTFVATGTSTTIAFEDVGTPNADGGFGPLLDNVSLCMTKKAPPVCSLTIKSDATDYVVEKNAVAKLLSYIHPSWVTAIGTSTAAWIWGDNPVVNPLVNETQTFKKGFNWTGGTVTSATLKLASDNSHAVTLGTFSGGNPGEFNYSSVTSYDVASGIVSGANTLEVEVENFAQANGTQTSNPAGLIYELTITGTGESCGTINPIEPEPAVTLSASKVVCDTAEAMPNGQLAKPITAATAQAWVDQSEGACRLVSGWNFEWGAAGAGNGGDATIGHAPNYTTFGPTNGSGLTTTVVPLANLGGRIEAREVLQSGYIPFSNDLGAEFYCANDAAGTDNWDWINSPVDGGTYHCVAFNMEVPPTTGDIEITKYECPADTSVVRSENGVDGEVPEGCVLQSGATFGYVYGTQTDANAPYPELDPSATIVNAGPTVNGLLTISNLPATGRYLIVETDDENEQMPAEDILGLYCEGDGDTSNTNDNQELTFVEAGETVSCVAYNKMEDDGGDNDPETYLLDGKKYACTEGYASRLNSYDYEEEYYNCEDAETVSGWTIYAQNGDNDPISTTTDENGYYYFEVEEGDWTVYEGEDGEDWEQVSVEQNWEDYENLECSFEINDDTIWEYARSFFNDSEEDSYRCDFYNYFYEDYTPQTYTVTGVKWNDVDGDGVRDEGEANLSNWEIKAVKGLTIISTTTNANGEYTLILPYEPGEWVISETLQSGWTQTGLYENGVKVTLGGEVSNNCSFELGILEPSASCDFGNKKDTVVTENPETPNPTITRRGGGSSGTLVTNRATPQPLILGAATGIPACGKYLHDYMRMGNAASTTQVTKLQVFLNAVGITAPLTGIFDAATDAAVRTFQAQHKAEVLTPWYLAKIVPHENPTGWVYQLTRWKINNIVCPGSEAYPVLN